MSARERKAELAELLAGAYLRSLPHRNRLDSSPKSEPSCPAVDGDETRFAFAPSPDEESA
jgi:hypothetical protein